MIDENISCFYLKSFWIAISFCPNLLLFVNLFLKATYQVEVFSDSRTPLALRIISKRLGITVFQPRLKVRTFARTNSYEYGKQRQVQESA